MTNFEGYKDKILEIVRLGVPIGVRSGVPVSCDATLCSACDFGKAMECQAKVIEWLYSEPKESDIDWTTIPVDTKIEVRHSPEDQWKKRYFACYDADGHACAWDDGATSFSVSCSSHYTSWEFARLY